MTSHRFPSRLNRWLAAAAAVSCMAACRAAPPDVQEAAPAAAVPPGDTAVVQGSAGASTGDTVVVQVSDTDTVITVSNESWWEPFPLDDYVQRLEHPASEMLDRRWGRDGRLYVLVRSVEASRSDPTVAFCGSGEEMHIVWLAADSTMRVVKEARVRVASCLMGRELEGESLKGAGSPWHVRFRIMGDTLATVEYDPRHPERGPRMTLVLDTLRM